MGAKFRIYPESRVEAVFREWCGQERFLVNMAVVQYNFASRHRAFAANPTVAVKSRQHWPSDAERDRQLTELRSTPEMEWLAAGSRKVQAQALRLTDRAYQNWFHNPTHFRRPKFRSKHDTQGFSLVGRKPGESGGDWGLRKINRRWAEVRLPKIGWTKFRLTLPWTRIADARSCRVTLDRGGRWHISFPGPQPEVFRTQTGAVAGVDRGVANTVAISDTDATGGGVEDGMGHAPGLSPKEAERVLRLERKLARQKKDSKRRELTRMRKAKVMARLVDQVLVSASSAL